MPTNFLWFAGTSNNGQLVAPISLLTTEMESVTNTSIAVSSVNGTSGVFNNSTTGQGIWGEVFFSVGSPGITSAVTAGGNICGWFMQSYDGGTTYESPAVVLARPADFFVPLPATTIGPNITAAGSWTTSSTTITMPNISATPWVLPGMNVYDTTNSQQIGTVLTWVTTTLTLTTTAAHASSGSTDALSFNAQPFKGLAPVMPPALPFKVMFQNNTGQTMGTGAGVAPFLKLVPIAMQF